MNDAIPAPARQADPTLTALEAETQSVCTAPDSATYIAITDIFVPADRQRRNPSDARPLEDLKRGILSKGLFHPPVLASRNNVDPSEPQLQLVAGERRLLAIRQLHDDGLEFTFNGAVVPPGYIPYTLLSSLEPADLEEAELEENILRAQLPWNEEADAKLKIHNLRAAQNPNQTLAQTAQEIVDKTQSPKRTVGSEASALSMTKMIQPYKDTPMVKGAKSLKKAYLAVIDAEKAKLQRTLRNLAPAASPHKLIHGDFFEVGKTLEENHFDVIFSDPPYGISADKQSFEKKHDYDDGPEYALSLYREIFVRGWKLLKPQGAVIVFCDIDHFKTIRTYAESMAYSTWRTPLIWHKGNEGPAPWGRNGFQRTYETFLYAVKGQRPLAHGPEPDVKSFARTNRSDRRHAAEKPVELLRYLLQLTCTTGCRVLDPCAGSGPLLAAAKDLGVELTLIERNEDYYNQLCARAQEVEASDEVISDEVEFTKTLEDIDNDIFG